MRILNQSQKERNKMDSTVEHKLKIKLKLKLCTFFNYLQAIFRVFLLPGVESEKGRKVMELKTRVKVVHDDWKLYATNQLSVCNENEILNSFNYRNYIKSIFNIRYLLVIRISIFYGIMRSIQTLVIYLNTYTFKFFHIYLASKP